MNTQSTAKDTPELHSGVERLGLEMLEFKDLLKETIEFDFKL